VDKRLIIGAVFFLFRLRADWRDDRPATLSSSYLEKGGQNAEKTDLNLDFLNIIKANRGFIDLPRIVGCRSNEKQGGKRL